ncbi:MAG: hypothetical protein DHS80DRAFT_24360 [Piptocephalis tieghemiana]|nr:MAG: hypothetical protein DHS80DRAFT_24360 [Piptocephalis tieghemiana]
MSLSNHDITSHIEASATMLEQGETEDHSSFPTLLSSPVPEDPALEEPPSPLKKPPRLLSLDVLRGLTIVLMVLINLQPPPPHALPHLQHAEFIGFTLADTVFPMFIFVMGLAIPLSMGRVPPETWRDYCILGRRILKRTILLYAIGLFLNGFPFADHNIWRTFRFTGVLQRQAVAYFFTSVAYTLLRSDLPGESEKRHLVKQTLLSYLFPLSLFILWMALTYGIQPSGCPRASFTPECCVEGWADRRIWGQEHNYMGAPFDPEGPIGHITSIITCWSGLMVGLWVGRSREALKCPEGAWRISSISLLIGVACIVPGLLFHPVIPIAKALWTPTFVLLTTGCSLASLGTLVYVVDIAQGLEASLTPFFIHYPLDACLVIGKNPLVLYCLHELIVSALVAIPIGESSNLWSTIFDVVFATWLPNELDGLVWGIFWVMVVVVGVAYLMDRRRLYIRI